MFKLLRDEDVYRILLLIITIVFIYYLGSQQIKLLHNARLKTQDLFFNIRHELKKPPPEINDVVIISIDDESFKALNKRWPWTRDVFATLIEKLKKFQSGLICIDLAFVGESADTEIDKLLAESMKNAGNVIIASHFSKEGEYILPCKAVRETALGFGFINKPRDIDYTIRRTRPIMLSAQKNVIDYSFTLKIAARFLGVPFENMSYDPHKWSIMLKPKESNEEYKYIINLRRDNTILLNYVAKPELFNIIPFWRVVAEKVNPDILKNKIVLVGTTAEIFHDIYQTPLGLMPGVLVNANEVLMYITNNFIKKVHDLLSFWIHFFLGITVLLITYRFGLLKGLISVIGLLLIAFLSNLYLLFRNYNWDFFGILFTALGSYVITYAYKNIGLLIDNMILRKEAITDGLTGLYVYRYFELKLRNEFNKARDLKNPLALIILDIDHFKKVNDTYGHENGNLILKDMATLVNKFSRKTDTVCRYGGEEFCVIQPNTDAASAIKYAENIRQIVESRDFTISKGALKVTASLGIATTQLEDVYTPDDLIKKADAALYRAKESGRNRVILFK